MKLSAPPPPPPEPNDPAQNPAGGPASSDTRAADATAPPPADTTAAPKKMLSWPAWFAGADFLLVVLVLALAFLSASFVARNADVWLHLAAGQRLLAGEYTPGTDPFSYSATDRTWVNHSILFDVAAYLLYSDNGMLLVVLKALAVVAAVGLVLALRRPGTPLWPWGCVGLVAVFAIMPFVLLRPVVGSMLLFAVTLFLLFRGNWRPGSWQFPIAIGVTFWLWANVDEWFFLGPLALALVFVGELIHRQLLQADQPATSDQANSPPAPPPDGLLGSLPDIPTLAKALGIGLLACMLNPHHFHVWQLPLEVTGAKELAIEPRFKQLLLTPLDVQYREVKELGYNQNGLAFAILFVAGGAALGLAGSRLRFAHLLLWLGFALLSLQSIYMIPFVALLAVPLVASELNALSTGLTLKTWGDPKTRVLLLGSGLGRVVVLIVAAVSCVLAWPGWVHPKAWNEAYVRRVGWAIEPEPGMVRGAQELQAWRTGDRPQLSPESRGLILSLEFANYCAWYAPREKVFANAHYRHHRKELRTYTEVRKAMGLVDLGPVDQPPTPEDLTDMLRDIGAEYVVVYAGPGDTPTFRSLARQTTKLQWMGPVQWSPWYLDGRTTVCGWRPKPGTERPSFNAMRFDPVVLAFGPDVERLRAGKVTPIQKSGDWAEAFLRSPNLGPPGADEVLGWLVYKDARQTLGVLRDRTWDALHVLASAVPVGWSATVAERAAEVNRRMAFNGFLSSVPDDQAYAAPILALRAAYRAIAADPDHPDGYWALFLALNDPQLPMDDPVRIVGQVTALRQCLQRFPAPENTNFSGYTALPYEVSRRLANLYLGRKRAGGPMLGVPINDMTFQVLRYPRGNGFLTAGSVLAPDRSGRPLRVWLGNPLPPGVTTTPPSVLPLDEAREMFQLSKQYLLANPLRNAEEMNNRLQELDREINALDTELGRMLSRYEQRKFPVTGAAKLSVQVEAALENNLVREAIKLLDPEKVDIPKEFGADAPKVILSLIALQLVVGRLEDATAILDSITTGGEWQKILADENVRRIVQMLQYHKCTMEGNFAEAGRIIETLEGEFSRQDPDYKDRQQFDPKPFVENKPPLDLWVQFGPLSALAAPTPHDVAARVFTPTVALGFPIAPDRYGGKRGFVELQNALRQIRGLEGNFYLRRGRLSLFEGDIKAARQRFLQTRNTDEQKVENAKWGLLDRHYEEAERYIWLIDEAAKRAQKK